MPFVPARAWGGGALSPSLPLFQRWRGPRIPAPPRPLGCVRRATPPLSCRRPPPGLICGRTLPLKIGKLVAARAQSELWRHYYYFSSSCWILSTTLSYTGPQIHRRETCDPGANGGVLGI